MNRTLFAKSVARRSVLSAIGAGLAGMLIRPLQAQEASGAPQRLLIVHRPCGTILENFFPGIADANDAPLPSILAPFQPLRSDMVIPSGVSCPRDQGWAGDQSAAGLITMMTGKRFVAIPGTTDLQNDANAKTIVAADASFDQYLLAQVPALQAGVASIQATAYAPSAIGLPSFKIMSYLGNNQPLGPQNDSAVLFKSLFGSPSAADIASADDDKSVLDCVTADLTRLQDLIPASQRDKLSSHLAAIQSLENGLNGSTSSTVCPPPMQAPLPEVDPSKDTSVDDTVHLTLAQNQLRIIETAFQCDLTRVATFTFAHGNSGLQFSKMVSGVTRAGGHYELSQNSTAADDLTRIDQVYCQQLVQCLQRMKSIPEGSGSLLDNTLVVFLSEVAVGNTHAIKDMPILLFGGKNLGLQGGRHIDFGGRYMNDIWSAISSAFGHDAPFGDQAFAQSPVSGLFA